MLCRLWCLAIIVWLVTVDKSCAQKIMIGPDVQVSSSKAGMAHFETQISASPDQQDLLLGCSMAFVPGTDRAETIVYVSRDRGKSWHLSMEDDRKKYSGDPSCVYGTQGMAYFTAGGYGPDLKSSMLFYRSKDSGKTWLPAETIQTTDREYITVDPGRGKTRDRVYVHGTEFEQPLDRLKTWSAISSLNVVQSSDQGATFEPPARAASTGEHLIFAMGNGAILSDGTLVMLYGEVKDRNNFRYHQARPSAPNAWLKIAKLAAGGRRLSNSTIVSDFFLAEDTPRWRHSIPSLAVDQTDGPFHDRLYAVWPDVRTGRTQIMFSRSEDKGQNWSPPTVVDDDQARPGPGAGPDDFMPVIAVNRKGVIGIAWYDRRDNPDNLGWWVRFSASLDGGETFLPSVRVSRAPFELDRDEELLTVPILSGGGLPPDWGGGGEMNTDLWIGRFDYTGGDTAGLAADAGGVFHPLWIDNRTGVPQVWTAAVTVPGEAIPNGDPELAALKDVSEKTLLEYSSSHYDRKTGIATLDVRLRNTSKDSLGNLKIRVLSLTSEAGSPVILNSDNHETGGGAVFDFTPVQKGQALLPGEESASKRIEIRITGMKGLRLAGGDPLDTLLSVKTKVLGEVEKK